MTRRVLQGAGMLAVAPLLRGVIKKMKAAMQTRQGPPLLQGYYDLAKLLRKETVRSDVASWVYVAGPRVYFATALAATTLVPVLVPMAPLEGAGGILGLVGILALGRFALATAALDTGSPFGGMGGSREMTIAALAEPALMLGLFTSALAAGSLDLGAVVRSNCSVPASSFRPSDIFALPGLFVVLIAETGRIPVDNPATHLELTMIHEAMVLEYAGPDLALVEWASARQGAPVHHAADRPLHADGHCHDRRARLRCWSPSRRGPARCSCSPWRSRSSKARTPSCACSACPSSSPSRWDWGSSRWRSDSCEVLSMTPNIVILCAAGMLVTAYLMVGQKSLFTTIRLYGAQSLLLATVAVVMAISDARPHLFVMATMTTVLKGFVIPLFLMRVVDRIGIHREIEPFLNVPTSLLACLGLTVVGYRVSTGFPRAPWASRTMSSAWGCPRS